MKYSIVTVLNTFFILTAFFEYYTLHFKHCQTSLTCLQVARATRPGGQNIRVPIARMKTRDSSKHDPTSLAASTNNETRKTPNFFSSKKIISRQRKHDREKNAGRGSSSRGKMKETSPSPAADDNVQTRLEKVKELFQIVKMSKRYSSKSHDDDNHNKPKSRKKTIKSNSNRRNPGDNDNDAVIEAFKAADVTSDINKDEALAKLFQIAGEDWVKSHVT